MMQGKWYDKTINKLKCTNEDSSHKSIQSVALITDLARDPHCFFNVVIGVEWPDKGCQYSVILC